MLNPNTESNVAAGLLLLIVVVLAVIAAGYIALPVLQMFMDLFTASLLAASEAR